MRIALTGANGFIGHYITKRLLSQGHSLRCLLRPTSQIPEDLVECGAQLEWVAGELGDASGYRSFVSGCEALVHNAYWRPGTRFRDIGADFSQFLSVNLVGSLELFETAIAAKVGRTIFISSCAVHEKILSDRALDETHPAWPTTHYGAYKAAVEMFVHSYGHGSGYPICSLRPSGVYGLHHHAESSKWYELIRAVAKGETVECTKGGKEVHAHDVARAVELLLTTEASQMRGESFSCCDRYVSQYEVATIAKQQTQSKAKILGSVTKPKHQIDTGKLGQLGFQFGGTELLQHTITQIKNNLSHA